MTKEIDHECTDEVVCPYCGYQMEGDCGDGPTQGKTQCGDCEKYFHCEPDFSVSYSTQKVDCLNGSDHNWRHDSWNDWDDKEYWYCRGCDKRDYRPKAPVEQKDGEVT